MHNDILFFLHLKFTQLSHSNIAIKFDLASRFYTTHTEKYFPSDYYFDILHMLITTTKHKQICQLTNNILRILNFNKFIKKSRLMFIWMVYVMNSVLYLKRLYKIFLLLNCKLLHHIIVITIIDECTYSC